MFLDIDYRHRDDHFLGLSLPLHFWKKRKSHLNFILSRLSDTLSYSPLRKTEDAERREMRCNETPGNVGVASGSQLNKNIKSFNSHK